MLSRRSFLFQNAPAAALASTALLPDGASAEGPEDPAAPRAVYEIFTIRLYFGAQFDRMMAALEKSFVPTYRKHGIGPLGFFTVEVGPHIPAVVGVVAYPSLAQMEASVAKLVADAQWADAAKELESEGPGFFREDSALLRATSFSPPLKPSAPGDPAHKIFELRIYESSTSRQHGFMHDRFAGGEIDVFHECGIHPILYADTVTGPNIPNMVYLTPFESEAHREKAWRAFRDHPKWKKLAEEWMRRSGELARNISNQILVPTSYSMLQ